MRRLLFIVTAVALAILLSKTAKGDSISTSVGIGDKAVVNYGLTLQKDWYMGYLNLENDIAGNASSNTTTLALGLHFCDINLGIYGGDQFTSGAISEVFGGEAGGTLHLGKGPWFLKDSVRIGRQTGSSLTYGSLSGGVGLEF